MSLLEPKTEEDVVYRTQSVIGKKRSRPSDSSAGNPAPRRTKSVGDARSLQLASRPPTPDEKGKGRESSIAEDAKLKRGMFSAFVKKALIDMENVSPSPTRERAHDRSLSDLELTHN